MRSTHRMLFVVGAVSLAMLVTDTAKAVGRGGGGRGGNRGGHFSGGRPGSDRSLDKFDGDRKRRGGNQPSGAGLNAQNLPGVSDKLQRPREFPNGPNQPGNFGNQVPKNIHEQAGQWQQNESRWRERQRDQGPWQQQAGQNAQQRWDQFKSGPEPFSPEWYYEHPNAWHATHPYADEAFVVTTAAVASWLGWAAYSQPVYGNSSTTVIYEQVPVVEEVIADPAHDSVGASDALANQGDWLPLGVYDVLPVAGQMPLQYLQLAVDRNGKLRGVYYDAVTNTSHNVVGSLSPATGEATWRLESNDQLTFRATLDDLTRPQGTARVSLPGGEQQWQLVRVEDLRD